LSNGAACYLRLHLGNARYEAVFAPDSHRLSFASDLNRDFLTLTHMDLSTSDADSLAPQLVFPGGPGWDVSSLYIAPQMKRLVYQVKGRWLYTAYHRVAIRWCRAPYRGLAEASRRVAEYDDPEKHRELLERIWPINHVHRIRAPLMVIHGADDPRVPVGEAEQIVMALRSRQVPVAYLRYEDKGHRLSLKQVLSAEA
jgi:pimeloyl-ACP methyl ester carboxylesterase